MLEKIYEVIKNNKSATFDEVYRQVSRTIRNRKDLSGYFANLEANNKVMYYNQRYYDLAQFPQVEGFINWNMTGFCWLTAEQKTNAYGLAFDSDTELNSIYNKKRAFPGHAVLGRQVTVEDKSFVFVEKATPAQDVKLITTYREKSQEWTALNCATIFNIPNSQIGNANEPEAARILNGAKDGEIVEFVYTKTGHLKLVSHLGNINQFGMETKILKTLTGTEAAPELSEEELKSIHLQGLKKSSIPFYTIDSVYTRDIDDAIFCEKTASGWKLSVAIADVSSFIKPNDKQDKHAQKNAISFYYPHEVNHLIDRGLAEEFCSLNPGKPKQSMICEISLNNEGAIVSYAFRNEEIISHARLTYNDVDTLIEGGKPVESKFYNGNDVVNLESFDQIPVIKESLKQMNALAKLQKFGRERDYFVVETPEYELDSFGKIAKLYFRDENKPSQKMVENAMLIANICTAKFLDENLNGLGMFRNQVEPEEGEFPKSAKYSAGNNGHWGLDLSHYTHFTSPIRRYCDLVNHRLIKDVLSGNKPTYSASEIESISENINSQQYVEKQISNKSRQLLLPQYIQRLQETNSLDMNLSIVDVSENGVVFRNSQLIEFFIPSFKVDEVLRLESQTISEQELDRAGKEAAIAELNKKYTVSFDMAPFSWIDERKVIDLHIKSNECASRPKI